MITPRESPRAPRLGQPALVEQIRTWIQQHGPMPFERFMEMALYLPDLGYYARQAPSAGPIDFQTSPQVHPAFGQVIGRFLRMVWRRLGEPDPFVVVEPGAGDGALAGQVLSELAGAEHSTPEAGRAGDEELGAPSRIRVVYHGVDPRGAGHGSVDPSGATPAPGRCVWWRSLGELVAAGVRAHAVISNEFFDALPVHRVVWVGGQLREIYVAWSGRGFVERLGEPSDPALIRWIAESGVVPPEGWQGEICRRLEAVWLLIARLVERGIVLTIDYGAETADLLGARWSNGTLLAYHRHQWNAELLQRVGEQDLTSQVDFGALERLGRRWGFQRAFLVTQCEFLRRLARPDDAERWIASEPTEARRWQARFALAELVRPGGLGDLKVLLQHRGMSEIEPDAW